MAFKHRKLFPTLTATNQTRDCPLFCDPTCPSNCYTYPDLYFPPPPPPPPSTDPKLPLSPYIIVIVIILVSFFLLVSYYAIIVKYCSNCNRSRNRPPPSQPDGAGEERLDENLGPVIDHPIWFITTVGLQQAIINSITICKYKKGEGLIEGTECSVCLSEFREEETLRLLPKCNHAFHIPCIDTWLRSHTNCPLCRARILLDNLTPNSASMDQNFQNLSLNEDTRMSNNQIDFELGEIQVRNTGFCENRAETEDGGELQRVNSENRASKEAVNSNGGTTVDNHQHMKDEIPSLRRSISMDSSTTSSISLSLFASDSVDSEGSSNNLIRVVQKSKSGCSSKEQTPVKNHISLKRSSSCGGRTFLPRHSRFPNSVLPLRRFLAS